MRKLKIDFLEVRESNLYNFFYYVVVTTRKLIFTEEEMSTYFLKKIPQGMEFVPFKNHSPSSTDLLEENIIVLGRGFDTRIIGWFVPIKKAYHVG